MSDNQSTSAQLRETQTALAKSQADLTRAEAELHDALRRASDLEQVRHELEQTRLRLSGYIEDDQEQRNELIDACTQRDLARAELASARIELHHVRAERAEQYQLHLAESELREALGAQLADQADELASLRAELDLRRGGRSWEVARNDDTPCARCGQQILRGYAVEPLPGAEGLYQHCFCPTPTKES